MMVNWAEHTLTPEPAIEDIVKNPGVLVDLNIGVAQLPSQCTSGRPRLDITLTSGVSRDAELCCTAGSGWIHDYVIYMPEAL